MSSLSPVTPDIVCFGYTARLFPQEVPLAGSIFASGLRVGQEHADGERLVLLNPTAAVKDRIWVDRYDAQLLLEIPSAAFSLESASDFQLAERATDGEDELFLDRERYLDLPTAEACHSEDSVRLLQSAPPSRKPPTSSQWLEHSCNVKLMGKTNSSCMNGVTGANKIDVGESWRERLRCRQPSADSSLSGATEAVNVTSVDTSGGGHAATAHKKRRCFTPVTSAIGADRMKHFIAEVTKRKAQDGRKSKDYWPASLTQHLMVEHVAKTLSQLGKNAEFRFSVFQGGLSREHKTLIDFVNQAHPMNVYFRLIKGAEYSHAQHRPADIPPALHQLFGVNQSPSMPTEHPDKDFTLGSAEAETATIHHFNAASSPQPLDLLLDELNIPRCPSCSDPGQLSATNQAAVKCPMSQSGAPQESASLSEIRYTEKRSEGSFGLLGCYDSDDDEDATTRKRIVVKQIN